MQKQNKGQQKQDNESINSSTSSYSEIIPRQQIISQTRKDKPIIIKSIPMKIVRNRRIQIQGIYSEKQISSTLINSTNANTNLQKSQISAQIYKNGLTNDNLQKSYHIVNILQNEQKQTISKSSHQKNSGQRNLNQKNSLQRSRNQKNDNQQSNYQRRSIHQQNSKSRMQNEQNKQNKQKQQMIKQEEKEKEKAFIQSIKEVKREQEIKNKGLKNHHQVHIESLIKNNQQLQRRVFYLQDLMKNRQTQSSIIRKANELYVEFYQTLSNIITKSIFNQQNQSYLRQININPSHSDLMSMDQILITVQNFIQQSSSNKQIPKLQSTSIQTQIVKKHSINSQINQSSYSQKINQLQIMLENADKDNSNLRKKLLQSTQNNINSIFNTQISASCCLQNQISKINYQMKFLKQRLNFLVHKNPNQQIKVPYSQIIYLPYQNKLDEANTNKPKKIVKIYTTKNNINQQLEEYQSKQEDFNNSKLVLNQRRRKKSRNKRSISSSSSISSKSTKKHEQMSLKQIQNLKQAYKNTKDQLNSLLKTVTLITNQQSDMGKYFNQLTTQIIKGLNQKHEILQTKLKSQKQQIVFQNQQKFKAKQQIHLEELKKRDLNYASNIQNIKKQRLKDHSTIQNLNQKINQLINTITVPQKVSIDSAVTRPQYIHEIQYPISFLSIPVDHIRLIQSLKRQNQVSTNQIDRLNREMNYLTEQIIFLKNMQARSKTHKFISHSINQSRQRKSSIINELNGFTQMSIASPLLINTSQNYIKNQKKSLDQKLNNKNGKFASNTQNLVQKEKQKVKSSNNFEKNMKVVLLSKQKMLMSLQKQILNYQQTNNFLMRQTQNLKEQIIYLKQQIYFLKQNNRNQEKVVHQLQNYILALQNKSINSISLSGIVGDSLNQVKLQNQQSSIYQNLRKSDNINLNSLEGIKIKYQNYVKNLKILLKQIKLQNQSLKQKIIALEIQNDQTTSTNFVLKKSVAHSERTTKNVPVSSSPLRNGQIIIRKKNDANRNQNQNRIQNTNRMQIINKMQISHRNQIQKTQQRVNTSHFKENQLSQSL